MILSTLLGLEGLYNSIIQLIIIITGLVSVKSMISLITTLVGQGDALKDGEEVSGEVRKRVGQTVALGAGVARAGVAGAIGAKNAVKKTWNSNGVKAVRGKVKSGAKKAGNYVGNSRVGQGAKRFGGWVNKNTAGKVKNGWKSRYGSFDDSYAEYANDPEAWKANHKGGMLKRGINLTRRARHNMKRDKNMQENFYDEYGVSTGLEGASKRQKLRAWTSRRRKAHNDSNVTFNSAVDEKGNLKEGVNPESVRVRDYVHAWARRKKNAGGEKLGDFYSGLKKDIDLKGGKQETKRLMADMVNISGVGKVFGDMKGEGATTKGMEAAWKRLFGQRDAEKKQKEEGDAAKAAKAQADAIKNAFSSSLDVSSEKVDVNTETQNNKVGTAKTTAGKASVNTSSAEIKGKINLPNAANSQQVRLDNASLNAIATSVADAVAKALKDYKDK